MTQTRLSQTQTLYFRVVFVSSSQVVSKIVNPNQDLPTLQAILVASYISSSTLRYIETWVISVNSTHFTIGTLLTNQ